MKLKYLSIFLLSLLVIASALELKTESTRSGSCCTSTCLKKCVKQSSYSSCFKPCSKMNKKLQKKGKRYFKKKFHLKSKNNKNRRVRRRTIRRSRVVRRSSGRRGRRSYSRRPRRSTRRRYSRRPRSTRRRSIRKIQRRRRQTKKNSKKRLVKKSKKQNKRKITKKLLSLTKFNTKRHYYLENHYWPHWNNYYSTYYPYYQFYWFFYNQYHSHYPHYYQYYFHHHPHVHHYHWSNKVVLSVGSPIVLSTANLATVLTNQYKMVKCAKGPKHILTVHHGEKHFRIFLGDVNDFVNLGCLYFMDSVVSVGKTEFVGRVQKLFNLKSKSVVIKGKKVSISPFRKSPFTPNKSTIKTLTKNSKVLSFAIQRKASATQYKKSILFQHLFNKQVKSGKSSIKILKGLDKHTGKKISNVLYIADHLNPKSIYILKHLLRTYKKLSIKQIVKITYRRIRIFSGIMIHRHRNLHHHTVHGKVHAHIY